MNGKFVDLHLHSQFSDGSFTPEEIVDYAKKMKLAAVALTDHDTTEGAERFLARGKEAEIELIVGVELSVEIESKYRNEMHILGYFLDWQNEAFQEKLKIFRQARTDRANKILSKLKELGIEPEEKKIFIPADGGAVGRLHIAKVLYEDGFVGSIEEAFSKYIGHRGPALFPKFRLSPEEAIRLILETKGIPVLAHPYYHEPELEQILPALVTSGLKGLECWHSQHSPSQNKRYLRLAETNGLIPTGGSDCHGITGIKAPALGLVHVPYSAVEMLKELKGKM